MLRYQTGKDIAKQAKRYAETAFSDIRDISKAIAEGNREAEMAYEMYAYRIKK